MSVDKWKEEFLNQMYYIRSKGQKLSLRPFAKKSKLQQFCFYFITSLVHFTSVHLFATLCLMGFKDWMEIINIVPNIGASVMSSVKYTMIHKNHEFYQMIFDHYHNDIWILIDDSKENIKTFIKYKHISKVINKFIIVFMITLIFVVDSFPFLLMTYENKVLGMNSPCLYPFDAWYPFNKVKWYSVTYIWEGLMTAIVICLYAFSNLLHLSYITFICMELSLLGNWLQRLISNRDIANVIHKKNLNETHNRIKTNLKFIIRRYEFLNELTLGLNKVLGDMLLLTYITGAIFICLTAFSSMVIDDLYKTLRYSSFCVSLLFEMFIQCIMGQVLVDQSVALTEKAYDSHWIYADAETKKMLLMLIMRTQRPFKLTAKGFVTMDLSTYSQICSSSYQLFNILRTMYEPRKN